MSTPPPSYLRVLRSDDDGSVAQPTGKRASQGNRDTGSDLKSLSNQQRVDAFWNAYTKATGWRIDVATDADQSSATPTRRPTGDLTGSPSPGEVSPESLSAQKTGDSDEKSHVIHEAHSTSELLGLRPADDMSGIESIDELGVPAVSAEDAQGLALAAKSMAEQLQRQQDVLVQTQLELAARASVVASHGSVVAGNDAIGKLLSDATMATGTDAAIVYMLDDETENLTARFLFGIAPENRVGVSRPLRGARTDLEAMIAGVVAVEDLRIGPIDTWKAPEDFAAGICVCIGDVDLPIGTMWLFANQARPFAEHETASARLASSNLHRTLQSLHAPDSSPKLSTFGSVTTASTASPESIVLPVSGVTPVPKTDAKNHSTTDAGRGLPARNEMLSQIGSWQLETLPAGRRLAPQWSIDGMIESSFPIAQSWHHWDVLPDGVISFAILQAVGNLSKTLDATVVRAALQAHACYRHSTHDAVTRVIDTLLQVRDQAFDDTGHPSVSLLYGHVDPESGQTKLSSVGDWSSLIVSRHGYRPLGLSNPIQDSRREQAGILSPQQHQTHLQAGEVLFIGGTRWMGLQGIGNNQATVQHRIGAQLKASLAEKQRSPLSSLRRMIADLPLTEERTAIALQRHLA